MMSKDNSIKKNLEEKFKKFLPQKDTPEDLKKEVFQTLDMLNLFGDMADLFTAKFSKTEAAFLGLSEEEEDIDDEPEVDQDE